MLLAVALEVTGALQVRVPARAAVFGGVPLLFVEPGLAEFDPVAPGVLPPAFCAVAGLLPLAASVPALPLLEPPPPQPARINNEDSNKGMSFIDLERQSDALPRGAWSAAGGQEDVNVGDRLASRTDAMRKKG
ncbi:hypothetical protein [Paraburkholderia sp. J12]|uniref:hypothetical protein n=1 Tax=Paraburkholderia sp. J12 TaxID=2805432 RepID=UPI002ABE394A|nr:hypothetical protein [Paraburkholderia sp. J12]